MTPVNTSSAAQTGWSINTRLTIDLIREHTKTTDVAHVTDNQLEHYRATAVEQCELYTGLIIGAPRFIQEQVPAKTPRFRASTVPYRTKHPSTDGLVYYRSSSGLTGMTRIEPGTRKVEVPAHLTTLGTVHLTKSPQVLFSGCSNLSHGLLNTLATC
jgi:hypothetical protein